MTRVLQRRTGHPPEERYKEIVSQSTECPVSVTNITNARVIFGSNVSGLRGRTTRETPVRVKEERVAIPKDFYQMHKKVTLTVDVMFVSGIPFLVTFSRNIKFRTAECVPRRTAKLLAKSIKKIIALYARGGFIVNLALMDKEFVKVQEHYHICRSTQQQPGNTSARLKEKSDRLKKERDAPRQTSHLSTFQLWSWYTRYTMSVYG